MAKRQPSLPGARSAHVTSPLVARPSAPIEWPWRLFECMTPARNDARAAASTPRRDRVTFKFHIKRRVLPNIDSQIATKQKAAARQ